MGTLDAYIFSGTSKIPVSSAMLGITWLVNSVFLRELSEWDAISFPFKGNIPDNYLRDEPPFFLLMPLVQETRAEEPVVGSSQRVGLKKKKSASAVRTKVHVTPTAHPLTDKEIQAFREKLKANHKSTIHLPKKSQYFESIIKTTNE